MGQHSRQLSRSRKYLYRGTFVLGVTGVLVAGTSVAYSSWTSTAAPPSPLTVSAGTVTLAFGSSQPDQLTVNASNIIPGDTIQRGVELSNTGTVSLASVTFGITDSSPSALVTGTSGLTASIASCSVAWTATALSSGGYTYSCSGTTTTVMAATSVNALLSTPVALSPVNSINPGGNDYLVVTLTLPSSAPNSDQGLSDSLTYNFNGVQQAGSSA
jgi:spore coat-associated protein N